SPMLDVGPAGFTDARHVEAVPLGDEVGFVGAQAIRLRSALFQPGVRAPAPVLFLQRLDGRREDERAEVVSHDPWILCRVSPCAATSVPSPTSRRPRPTPRFAPPRSSSSAN